MSVVRWWCGEVVCCENDVFLCSMANGEVLHHHHNQKKRNPFNVNTLAVTINKNK